jgi:GNAT superfamily N-acetyltransferase
VQALIAHGSITIDPLETLPEGVARPFQRLPDLLERLSAQCHTSHFFCPHAIHLVQLKEVMVAFDERQTRVRVSLGCRIDGPVPSNFMALNNHRAIVQIQWHITGKLPDLGFFKACASAGIWNHLALDGASAAPPTCQAIARQPNIVHSWEAVGDAHVDCHPDQAYVGVRPLPGRPLWQAVNDPLKRFVLADRLTRDRLIRLRIDDDGASLYTVGNALEYHFIPPDRLPGGYLDEICAMVVAGGTVAATHVRANLERAHLIGYALEKGVIVGNSSLKNPRPEYIEAVRRQSGLDLTGFVERGYTSVRPEYRGLGIGTRLLEGLTRRAGDRKIFSVIAEDNTATKVIALRNHTRQVASYFSEKAGKPVGIWMPAWMIDTGERERPR